MRLATRDGIAIDRRAGIQPYRRIPALFGLLLLSAVAAPMLAQGKPVIVWHALDFPPLTIIQGPLEGQGFVVGHPSLAHMLQTRKFPIGILPIIEAREPDEFRIACSDPAR